MAIRMTKPWRALAAREVARLTGQLGVYHVGDEAGNVLFVGVAGGRSRFGLRGELEAELARRGPGFRFRVEFAVAAIIALIHDTLFTVGILVTRGEEFTLLTISALLTLVGYSLNDSIVVFDRVRENLNQMRGAGLVEVINTSINQMLRRTILTSGTTLVAVLALLLLGGPVLHGFAFTLLIGIVVGTYSSIYIASPVLILWHRVRERRRQR